MFFFGYICFVFGIQVYHQQPLCETHTGISIHSVECTQDKVVYQKYIWQRTYASCHKFAGKKKPATRICPTSPTQPFKRELLLTPWFIISSIFALPV